MPDVVILAAGLGTRFGGLKQLAPVGPAGETLLHYAIYDARRAGFERIVLVIRPDLEAAVRERVIDPLSDAIPIALAHQDLPATRRKPWGTGHAVLAARADVRGDFAVCNADDFYGASAYRAVCDHLRGVTGEGVVAGYRLRDTLSDAGGVSRALCRADDAGLLTEVVELRDVARRGAGISGAGPDGSTVQASAEALVSTNLWGLPDTVFDGLGSRFDAFRRDGAGATREFLLSTALNDMIGANEVRIRLRAVDGPYLGITRAGDQAAVSAALRWLVAEEAYPDDVVAALRGGD